MKFVSTDRLEEVSDYRIVEGPAPTAGENELVIRVMACGMGFVDTLVALGRYQVKPPTPFTPGHEVGGIVEAVGPGVSGFARGDRVMAYSFGGGLAEFVAVPRAMVVGIPDTMSFEDAAGFRINYLTAMHGLRDRANVRPGERVLVIGAAGGVGTAAIQIARLLGAEVIAAASTAEKRAFASTNGAHHCIDTDPEGWRDRLKALCNGKGPDVVFDPVSGPLFELAHRSLVWGGRHLVVGFASGAIPKLPANLPLVKGSALVGVDVNQFQQFAPETAQAHLEDMMKAVAEGLLRTPSGRRFAFAQFAEAMDFAISGVGPGRAVVQVAAAITPDTINTQVTQ